MTDPAVSPDDRPLQVSMAKLDEPEGQPTLTVASEGNASDAAQLPNLTRSSDLSTSMDVKDKDGSNSADNHAERRSDHGAPLSTKKSEPQGTSLDLAESIPGMYRVLDLISEQGSGGLVDKIVIAQDSLARFIEEVSPGAYQSLTKIDFKALDTLSVKPIGVYGSKPEIVKLLETTKSIDGELARLLLAAKDDSPGRKLRSGLYFVRMTLPSGAEEQLLVVYWPEDTTWDDNAVSAVRKNRVTFIRYLTKIADQTMCLISPEHAQRLVWNEATVEEEDAVDLEEDGDRFFAFEVAKTNEQEEGVTIRDGIQLSTPSIRAPECPPEANIDASMLAPKLIAGETSQAFLTARYIPGKTHEKPLDERAQNKLQVESFWRGSAIHLDESLSAEAIDCLMHCGLQSAFPTTCHHYQRDLRTASEDADSSLQKKRDEIAGKVDEDMDACTRAVRSAIVDRIVTIYPLMKDRDWQGGDAGGKIGGETTDKVKTDHDKADNEKTGNQERQGHQCRDGEGVGDATSDDSAEKRETAEVANDADPHAQHDCAFSDGQRSEKAVSFQDLTRLFPDMQQEFDDRMKHDQLEKISKHATEFRTLKERLIFAQVAMDSPTFAKMESQKRENLLSLIIAEGDLKGGLEAGATKSGKSSFLGKFLNFVSGSKDATVEDDISRRASDLFRKTSDAEFLSNLNDLVACCASLQGPVTQVIDAAHAWLDGVLRNSQRSLTAKLQSIRQLVLHEQVKREVNTTKEQQCEAHRRTLIREINEAVGAETLDVTHIKDIYDCTSRHSRQHGVYRVVGHQRRRLDPLIEYTIHPLGVPRGDREDLQFNPRHIPSLREDARATHMFKLPAYHRIRHIQLLGKNKCLLIVDNCRGNFLVYLEDLSSLPGAVEHEKSTKVLHQDKLGADIIFAFDETTRLLALCSTHKMSLHVYALDEDLKSIKSAHIVELNKWYSEGTSIHQMCMVSCSEEVLVIDVSGQARIFSLISQQFRPATLLLGRLPIRCMSSPDGGCLLLVFKDVDSSELLTRAYHWGTFGSGQGINLDLPLLQESPIPTSIVQRGIVHLAWIDHSENAIRSYALDITKKVTEFSFQEKGAKRAAGSNVQSVHNSLVECHADVWTRFPVVPAIPRRTVVTDANRQDRRLIFVSEYHQDRFALHFSEMIQSFEQRTRKPTGKALRSIQVDAASFEDIKTGVMPGAEWDSDISRLRLGEWLVDVFCLIPIHIAVTRDNRFIPLKDGVYSAELERTLLGADVGQIVDALSVGWYESIFQSYQSSKPVKVVSSMGEQSVGKSFALNHLADTSFAGSAMRTTEGVWMSVTPTDSSLVVALDFEGVHSIERSAQEDMLLVLFNAAISNLVLFRNNFALSRDITGLFQSFQSSSMVLDPAANPTLFQSTLVIIIKDVVESDKNEIVKEFSLKFQQIVQQEQDANFISKLHAGKLNIIPWPVIESKQFYAYFPALKKSLDKQSLTHSSGVEFLQTLKTLMAKLKSNDWGSIDQTLAAHRAGRLLETLPVAFARGFTDPYDDEQLKNMDTDEVIQMPDTKAVFHVSVLAGENTDPEFALATLRKGWTEYSTRHAMAEDEWVARLSFYLEEIVDQRTEHVFEWLDINLERFRAEHANIDNLRRTSASISAQMKADIELCKVKCSKCNLLCLRSRRHSSHEPHDCQTDHRCPRPCDYAEDHIDEGNNCGLPAGHSGKHICVVERHLCGEVCDLSGLKGCLGDCMKTTGHSEDEPHMCAAQIHACGEPCDLVNIPRPDGSTYSCKGTCRIPSHEEHQVHICDVRMCPLGCELCQRLCSDTDHLHALDTEAHHLCGQTHPCPDQCRATGICEIDTTPLSIEATFSGRHETFQYTKYTQVAKRLQCAMTIPADRMKHDGEHIHTTVPDAFHFCETRCGNCGYLCTLPRGHSQQEHDTSHGSMSKTRWALDDEDGSIELNGRKFGADDEGAPMLCNLVCKEMGRHVHVDRCRTVRGIVCQENETEHINARMRPGPDIPKDWISHSLFWKRTGFKDPYSKEDQTNFAKCDAMCSGPEHAATAATPAHPSHCTLPIFHTPEPTRDQGLGYVSNDGHYFACKNPVVLQQAFHVIFVVDRSSSMGQPDRRPLPDTPGSERIRRYCDNRLGAVYSALYSFWVARNATVTATAQTARRDAYSVILFDAAASTLFANDFTRTPDQLLREIAKQRPGWGTDFEGALKTTEALMRQHWSTERTPVVIFLSDGESSVTDETVHSLCQAAVQLGKHLSFHAVSFGTYNKWLKRMAKIARGVQARAPRDPALPPTAYVESSYVEALDSVRLAETFLGLADSLRKPRGALIR